MGQGHSMNVDLLMDEPCWVCAVHRCPAYMSACATGQPHPRSSGSPEGLALSPKSSSSLEPSFPHLSYVDVLGPGAAHGSYAALLAAERERVRGKGTLRTGFKMHCLSDHLRSEYSLAHRLASESGQPGWQGMGSLTWSDGASYSGQWAGDAAGQGLFRYANGNCFTGQYSQGLANGLGVYRSNGVTYKGSFLGDVPHGYGVEIQEDGTKYLGTYRLGLRQGPGMLQWLDGSIYEGQWSEDCIHGFGRYCHPDGRCYAGQWRKGTKHGRGSYIFPDGRQYTGQYVDDRKHGFGCFLWADGRCYKGHWIRGRRNAAS